MTDQPFEDACRCDGVPCAPGEDNLHSRTTEPRCKLRLLAELEPVAARYARALAHIVNVLGPTDICKCKKPCDGLRVEAAEALDVAKRTLAGEEP